LLGRPGIEKPQKHEFTYTGIIRCGYCGSAITASRKRKWVQSEERFKEYEYYHCTRKNKKVHCSQQPVKETDLDGQIIGLIEKIEIPKELEDNIKASTHLASQSLTRTKADLDNLSRMRYREQVDEDFYLSEKQKLNSHVITLEDRIENADKYELHAIQTAIKTLTLTIDMVEKFKSGTVSERKDIIRAIGSNYILNSKKLLFSKAEWLSLVEKGCPPTKAANRRLEPIKSPYYTRSKTSILKMFSHLVSLFRTCSNSDKNMSISTNIFDSSTRYE
jgi:hypothetical protein